MYAKEVVPSWSEKQGFFMVASRLSGGRDKFDGKLNFIEFDELLTSVVSM